MKWNLYISIALTLCLATLGLETGNFRRPKAVLAAEKITNNTTFNRWTAKANTERLLAGCRRSCPDGTTSYRGGQSDRIPYIISPRNTYLLTNRPILRWNRPLQGAKSYTVRLKSLSSNIDIWEKQNITDNKLAYPSDLPPLEPGVEYSLIVKVEDGLSSVDEQVSVTFNVLDAKNADDVRAASALISKQQLPEETKSLLLAYLYTGYYLRAEAIELLEPLAATSQTPAVHRLLGDLYWQVGLASLALPYYLQTVKLASATQELAELAAAQLGLGEIYEKVDKAKAIDNLKSALELYKKLGNQQQVIELQERIKKLSSKE
jgi:tetratricopeptide (TPR) repeat protein